MPNQDTHRKPAPTVAGGHAGKDARPALVQAKAQTNTAANQTLDRAHEIMVRPGSVHRERCHTASAAWPFKLTRVSEHAQPRTEVLTPCCILERR
jgi:hypothetical protein